jgi:hypothetical protein
MIFQKIIFAAVALSKAVYGCVYLTLLPIQETRRLSGLLKPARGMDGWKARKKRNANDHGN